MLSVAALPLAFDRADALALGWTRHQFHRRTAADDVREVAPRVFADTVAWHLADRRTRHCQLARHAQRRYTGSVVSHSSAAVLHGLPSPRSFPTRVSLSIDKGRGTSDDPDWIAVQRSALPTGHVTTVDGVRVTTWTRTAVDCLRVLSRPDGLAVADAVVRRGVHPGELIDMRRFQTRWPGVRTARWGIGLVDGRRESWLESASTAVLYGWIAPPVPQVDVHDRASGRFVGRVDSYWRTLRVAGEADGLEKYRGLGGAARDEAAVADRLIAAEIRAERLRELGLGVVRWGTADLDDGRGLAGRILAARPTRPWRAELACGVCRQELDDCRCAPALCLPTSASDEA